MAETARTKITNSPADTQNNPDKVTYKNDRFRQRVPMKRETPVKKKGYVSPFLAEKNNIDAKFVHLQCIWRDLEQARQEGKNVIKNRGIEHRSRNKIKRHEDVLDTGVIKKPTGITDDVKTGIRKLLKLERQLDENDNQIISTKTIEYRTVVHDADVTDTVEPTARSVEIPSKRVALTSSKHYSKDNLVSPNLDERVIKKGKPLKLSTESLRSKSVYNVSGPSSKNRNDGDCELATRKITLTKPNSPLKIQTKSDPLGDATASTPKQRRDNPELSLRTGLPTKVVTTNSESKTVNTKSHPNRIASNNNDRITKPNNTKSTHGQSNTGESVNNVVTSVKIQLDSSFSEDDAQHLPVYNSRQRKISVKQTPSLPKSKLNKNDNDLLIETPVTVMVNSELNVGTEAKANKAKNLFVTADHTERTNETVDSRNSISHEKRDKRDSGRGPKENIVKLQNIQCNIQKIVCDIQESKKATGHVNSDDVSSCKATVTSEDTPLKRFPQAKHSDKMKTEKESRTLSQRTSVHTLNDEDLKGHKDPSDCKTMSNSHAISDSKQTVSEDNLTGKRLMANKNTSTVKQIIDGEQTERIKQNNNMKNVSEESVLDIPKKDRSIRDNRKKSARHKEKLTTENLAMKNLSKVGLACAKDKGEQNETSHELVPVKGGGHRRIVRHRSSRGKGQDPEDVATDLQKALLTSKKVIESQLAGIIDEKMESDNLVGALKRSMTKPTAREKVAAATSEIHEIIQDAVINEKNGSKTYQVKIQMGPFMSDINYTQDDHIVIVEGSTNEPPRFTKEIKVEFPSQGLDMELLSVHNIGSVVELNVPFIYDPTQTLTPVSAVVDQYISDEVSALKREYMQPWLNEQSNETVTEAAHEPVTSPSTLQMYLTENDIQQAAELDITPGEETKDVLVYDLDPPKSPNTRRIPPMPKFAPPPPPTLIEHQMKNGNSFVDTAADKVTQSKPRKHRRNMSQSSNTSISSSDISTGNVNSSNNNNIGIKSRYVTPDSSSTVVSRSGSSKERSRKKRKNTKTMDSNGTTDQRTIEIKDPSARADNVNREHVEGPHNNVQDEDSKEVGSDGDTSPRRYSKQKARRKKQTSASPCIKEDLSNLSDLPNSRSNQSVSLPHIQVTEALSSDD